MVAYYHVFDCFIVHPRHIGFYESYFIAIDLLNLNIDILYSSAHSVQVYFSEFNHKIVRNDFT